MLRPIFAVLPLDIHSLCYRARVSVWGSADAALGGVQRFSPATARRGVARVLRPVAAVPGCVARAAACGSTWAAGSGVQRFWRRFSFEILTLRVVMDLLRSPSRFLIEIGDFDSRRQGQIPQKGFFEKVLEYAQNWRLRSRRIGVYHVSVFFNGPAQLVEHQSLTEDTTVNLGDIYGYPHQWRNFNIFSDSSIPLRRAFFFCFFLGLSCF